MLFTNIQLGDISTTLVCLLEHLDIKEPGQLFEHGFWDGGGGQLMEVEILDACDPLPQALDEDSMWEDDLNTNDKPAHEKLSLATLAWQCTMWACMKIAKVVPGFHWDGKMAWWINRILAEKLCQWEEEDCLAREKGECRKMGRRWVNPDGDQLMPVQGEEEGVT